MNKETSEVGKVAGRREGGAYVYSIPGISRILPRFLQYSKVFVPGFGRGRGRTVGGMTTTSRRTTRTRKALTTTTRRNRGRGTDNSKQKTIMAVSETTSYRTNKQKLHHVPLATNRFSRLLGFEAEPAAVGLEPLRLPDPLFLLLLLLGSLLLPPRAPSLPAFLPRPFAVPVIDESTTYGGRGGRGEWVDGGRTVG